MDWEVELLHLYVSPDHNYRGRHGKGSRNYPIEDHETIQCVEGSGIRGDRYFNYKEDFKGQITFFADEVCQAVKERFGLPSLSASAFRRNVITRGLPLNELIGHRFALQGLEFEGVEEAKPCYWMDQACAEGVERFLVGQGGLRARIKVGGQLKRGTAGVEILP